MQKQEIYNFGNKLEIKKSNIDLILQKITGLDKSQLFLSNEIDDRFLEEIEDYFSRLVSGEPIEYIIEKAEFFGLDFFVDSRVLVPRNDTEVMVEKSLSLTLSQREKEQKQVLIDVGTGSSCIAISILQKMSTEGFSPLPKCFVVDISKKALEVSKINIKKYNLEDKIIQINGDLLENFLEDTNIFNKNGDINLENIIITANLPYIKNGDYENMDMQTINFEPDLALYGGEKTGFELYEKLIYQVLELTSVYNIKKIILFIEIGFDQKEIAKKFLKKLDLKYEIFKDNGGIDRCIKIYF